MTETSSIPQHIKDEAREWHVLLHSGEADLEARDKFEIWLHSNRAHKTAYHAFEQLYRDLDYAMPRAGVDVDELLDRRPAPILAWLKKLTKQPTPVVGALAAAAAALFFVAVSIDLRPVAPSSAYATEVAEISEVRLEDGTIITLGAKSRIEAQFTEGARRVNLISGEAFFDVAKDPSRPFFVAADDTLVRVVGTKFDVKSAMGKIKVSVLEGTVEVIKPGDIPRELDSIDVRDAPSKVLTAGERVTADQRVALSEVKKVELAEPGAWRSGRLAYEDASLAEIVSDLNRYHKQQIRIATRDVAGLRTTITFNTAELEPVLDMVAAIHPITVDRIQSDAILLRRASNDEE